MSKNRVLLAVAVACCPCVAQAAQGPVFGGPVGSTDLGNAYLPAITGFYFGTTTGFGWSSRLYNNDYKALPGASHAQVTAAYLMYLYPFKVFGGNLASGIEEAYQADGTVLIPNIGRPYQQDTGWLDLYVDLLNWSRYVGPIFGESTPSSNEGELPYGLTVKAEYSMIFPTGHYDPNAIVSPSGGTFFFIPNAAITYLTPPDFIGEGVEIDLHSFLDAQAKNWKTNYQSGDVVDLDYAVGQRIKNWTVGVAGSYTVQTNGDQIGPSGRRIEVSPDGNRLEAFTLGPIASVYVPKWHVSFKVKAPIELQSRNALGISAVYLNAFFKF